jgi:hypothetical protein
MPPILDRVTKAGHDDWERDGTKVFVGGTKHLLNSVVQKRKNRLQTVYLLTSD